MTRPPAPTSVPTTVITRPPPPTAIPSAPQTEAATPAPPAPTPGLASPLLGDWAFRGHVPEREIGGTLRFVNASGRLAGFYVAPNGRSTPLANIQLEGEKVSFGIVGSLGTWHLIGVLNGNRMSGTFETLTRVVPWEAARGGAVAAPPSAPSAPVAPAAPAHSAPTAVPSAPPAATPNRG